MTFEKITVPVSDVPVDSRGLWSFYRVWILFSKILKNTYVKVV